MLFPLRGTPTKAIRPWGLLPDNPTHNRRLRLSMKTSTPCSPTIRPIATLASSSLVLIKWVAPISWPMQVGYRTDQQQ